MTIATEGLGTIVDVLAEGSTQPGSTLSKTNTAPVVLHNAAGQFIEDGHGNPIECDFTGQAWAAGDVLESEFNFLGSSDDDASAIAFWVLIVVSFDNWATKKFIAGGASVGACLADGFAPGQPVAACSGGTEVALAAAPKVRLWYLRTASGNVYLGDAAAGEGQGCRLKCRHVAAATYLSPPTAVLSPAF